MNQTLTLALLEKMGLFADIAEDGKQALSMLDKEKYDLILMDCKMPVLDGLETTKIIRTRESNHGEHIPIIAVTANAIKGDCQKCLDAGMDDYISKPFTKKELANAIYKWLPQAKQAQPIQDS
ncbi:response regulator [Pseudomonadota bacterium]